MEAPSCQENKMLAVIKQNYLIMMSSHIITISIHKIILF